MQTRLLIVCQDESRSLSMSDGITQGTAGDIVILPSCLPTFYEDAAWTQPDVLLIEHSAVRDRAQQILAPFVRRHPAASILFLCDSCPRELMLSLIGLGGRGCVLYCDPPALIAKAVQSVHKGETWFGRSSLMLAVRSLLGTAPAIAPRSDEVMLTSREDEIFDLIGRGLTNKEIARQLDISDHTVKTHLHRVYVKLQQSGRYKALLSQPGRQPH